MTGPGDSASPKAPKALVDLVLQLEQFEGAMERDAHGIAPNGARYRIVLFTNDKHAFGRHEYAVGVPRRRAVTLSDVYPNESGWIGYWRAPRVWYDYLRG